MTRKQTAPPTDEIHQLTVAEIARQQREYGGSRQAATTAFARIFASRKAGQPDEPVLSEHARTVRERAKAMMNGNAPPGFALPPATTREQELRVEVDAIDLVLKTLSDSELPARAAEGAQWARDHADDWAALCKELTLAAVRFEALEQRANRLIQEGGGIWIGRMIMTGVIGRGNSIAERAMELTTAAIDERVLSRGEIERAKNVE